MQTKLPYFPRLNAPSVYLKFGSFDPAFFQGRRLILDSRSEKRYRTIPESYKVWSLSETGPCRTVPHRGSFGILERKLPGITSNRTKNYTRHKKRQKRVKVSNFYSKVPLILLSSKPGIRNVFLIQILIISLFNDTQRLS